MIRFLGVYSGRLSSALLALVLILAAAGCGSETPTVPPEDPSAWYVSPQGSDTQNSCHSFQSPCQTINAVLLQASSPVLIYIAAGTYNEYIHLYDMVVDLEGSGPGTILNGGITHPVEGGVIDSICTSFDSSQCHGALTVANLTIHNGWSEMYGGGVYVRSTTLIMKNVILSGNRSSSGGALYIDTSAASLDNVTVSGNVTNNEYNYGPYNGAGIYNNKSHLSITNSTIFGNTMGDFIGDGGGIYNLGQTVLYNVVIAGNSTQWGDGGGIKNASDPAGPVTIRLTNSTLRDNHANHGGGLSNDNAVASLTGTTINDNTSTTAGGGILNTNLGNLQLINSTISGNKGGNEGGGIVSNLGSTLMMTNVTLANNQATHTGPLMVELMS